MKEVTGSSTPGTPGTGIVGGGGTVAARPFDVRRFVIAVVVLFLVIWVVKSLFFHANHYEALADRVTKAIAGNDMRPVEGEFNALRRPQLEDRGKVGRLSDFVNAEGAFKSVKEDTPSGSQAGYHHFIAHFDKGDLAEDLTVDADGKIADFHVKPLN
jgi:hypothetical protein